MTMLNDSGTPEPEPSEEPSKPSAYQMRIHQELLSLNPTLGDLYMRAVAGCASYGSEGDNRAHIALVSHAVRELTNALPDVLSGTELPEKRYGPVQASRRRLFDLIDTRKVDESSARWLQNDPETLEALIGAVVEYRKEEAQAGVSARERSAYALLGSPRLSDASLNPWEKARSFFMDYVHVDRTFRGKLPSRTEVAKQFSRIEAGLSAPLRTFFVAKHRLAQRLEATNSVTGGEYARPSDSEVLDLLAFLADENLRFIFYTSLENPRWLGPLHAQNAFAVTPPDPDTGICRRWPQGEYLRRMAKTEPVEVSEIVATQLTTENWIAREQIISIANELPGAQAAKLAAGIAEWADSPDSLDHWYWEGDDIVELIVKLQTDPSVPPKPANRLLYACFEPKKRSGYLGDIAACVPDFKYAEALEAVSANLTAEQTCRFATKMLVGYQNLISEQSPMYLDSSYSIPDMVASGRESRSSIPAAPSKLAVTAMTALSKSNPGLLGKLLRKESPAAVQRAAVLSIALAIEECRDGEGPLGELGTLAEAALDSGRLFSREFDSENHRLCRACSTQGLTGPLSAMQRRLVGGIDDDALPARRGPIDPDDQSRALLNIRRGQHRHLLAIDEPQLTEEAKTLLARLNGEFGKVDYHDRHAVETNWDGPKPGKSASSLQTMAPSDAISFLAEWEPEDFYHDFSGQANALADLIRDDPCFFEGHEEELAALQPGYCGAAAYAWHGLVCQDKRIPYGSTLKFCLATCENARLAVTATPDKAASDPHYSCWVATLTLMLRIIEASSVPLDSIGHLRDGLFSTFRSAVLGLGETAADEREAPDGGMLPLTVALNTVRPLGFRGLMAWAKAFNEGEGNAELGRCIQQALRIACHSEAMAAQISECVGTINELGFDCKALFEPLVADEERSDCHQVFVTTFLALYYPHSELLPLIEPGIESIMTSETDYKLGIARNDDDALDLVGRWADFGYVVGAIEIGNPIIERWEHCADADHLGKSLEYACRALYNTSKPTPEVLERIAALWDRRAALAANGEVPAGALRGLHWLVKSKSFEIGWWAPRLKAWCGLNPRPRDLALIDDQVNDLAKNDPGSALAILARCASEALHDSSAGAWLFSDIAVPVLFEAEKLQSEESKRLRAKCMDDLAQLGMIAIDEQIAEYPGGAADDDGWMAP